MSEKGANNKGKDLNPLKQDGRPLDQHASIIASQMCPRKEEYRDEGDPALIHPTGYTFDTATASTLPRGWSSTRCRGREAAWSIWNRITAKDRASDLCWGFYVRGPLSE